MRGRYESDGDDSLPGERASKPSLAGRVRALFLRLFPSLYPPLRRLRRPFSRTRTIEAKSQPQGGAGRSGGRGARNAADLTPSDRRAKRPSSVSDSQPKVSSDEERQGAAGSHSLRYAPRLSTFPQVRYEVGTVRRSKASGGSSSSMVPCNVRMGPLDADAHVNKKGSEIKQKGNKRRTRRSRTRRSRYSNGTKGRAR